MPRPNNFFGRLKAKHAQEEITALEGNNGNSIDDREGILEEVHKFYEDLYAAEVETDSMRENRRVVVGRIDRRFTSEQNLTLEEMPSEELITTIVMEMPKEKSPGLDGVMVEILRIGWEFMREECFQMVQSFWDHKKLRGKDSKGVIKLIPKNDRRHLLQNWRPITLPTTTYKIIAKIIAVRLKDMLPGLIDLQQTGFVAGRNIIDNILSLRLGQEWAQVSDQNVLFVKLDFMKAYDRVAHGFLWDTLGAMGMGEGTVDRIKGLVEGGSSEVHVNGSFTKAITIGRGVRQGCPLAPLLFAMTTQPLMRALREEERRGNIQGLNLGGGHSLLHQLFADDTGICITAEEEQFEKLMEVIQEFESASGACLNLQKSIVMQLKPGPQPTWEPQTCADCLGEDSSREGRGRPRMDEFQNHGGCSAHQADRKNFGGRQIGMGAASTSFILRTPRRGAYQRETMQWTLQESLVLLPLTRIEGSPTLTRILGSWHRARKRLRWDNEGGELDGRLTMLQVKALHQVAKGFGVSSLLGGREIGLLRRLNVRSLGEAMEISREGSWRHKLRSRGIFPEEEVLAKLDDLEEWCRMQRVVQKNLTELEGWKWDTVVGEFQWINPTKVWRQLITKERDFSETMEGKWQGQSQLLSWQQRWKLLWEVPIPYRRRIWLWRTLQRGFFTNKRAADMGLQTGTCKRCVTSTETVEHILWSCRKTERRRRHLVQLTCPDKLITSLLEWIDVALRKAQRNPASLLICILYCWTAWRERNDWQFNQKDVNRPVHSFLTEVELEIFALGSQRNSDERKESFERAKVEIGDWKLRWDGDRRMRREEHL
ncbi:hypothetical protein R1sor_004177 [Riccia sorocarpa]|uniref:Reverse transcriptase domain-containing protein n=1 Tax=Riccia sorocarpa TaxID=122646 RepID=A0ABD3H722_9MARC